MERTNRRRRPTPEPRQSTMKRSFLKIPLTALLLGPLAGLAIAGCGDDEVSPDGGGGTAPDIEEPGPTTGGTTSKPDEEDPVGEGGENGGGGAAGGPSVEPKVVSTLGRLLVGDSDPENPRMQVVDLDDGTVVADFPTLGSIRAYASEAGSGFAWANQRVPGVVEIIASGLVVHEDGSVEKYAPYILSERLEAPLPTHWVSHDSWVVSFNDGDGTFDMILERTLGTDRFLSSRATTDKAHHGVALVSHGNVFATLPNPDPEATSTLPVGVTVRKLATPNTVAQVSGIPLQSDECPALHGEGSNDEVVAFGCGDDVLLAVRGPSGYSFRKLANPEGTPAGRRVGTVQAVDGIDAVVGNWGNGFVIIPYKEESPTWIPVDLGSANRGFLFDAKAKSLVVLAGDGSLRKFDGETGELVGTALTGVIPAVEAGQPAPGFSLGADVAFIADPRSGSIVEVDLEEWEVTRTIDVGGMPNSVAAFGYYAK